MIGGLLVALTGNPAHPDTQECLAQLEAVREAYYARYQSGIGDWARLMPIVAQAHRCFGDARTAAHAKLFDYETSILVQQRRFADVEEVFERFFGDYATVARPDVVARMHARRGYVYSQLSWMAQTLIEYTLAVAGAGSLEPREQAWILSDAAEHYRNVGDLETARQYLAVAESLLVQLNGEDPEGYGPMLGTARMRRAHIALNEGERGLRPEHEAAEIAYPLLQSALRLIPGTPAEAFSRIVALLLLADVQHDRGDLDSAMGTIDEARNLSSWVEEAYPQLLARIWRKEARTLYLLGRHDAALRAYEAALETARRGHERDEEWNALMGLGEVAEARARTHRGSGLEMSSRQAAEEYYRQAAAIVEQIRRTYGLHGWSASAWESTQEPYLHLARVLLQQERAAEAFVVLDETRARYLRDLRTAAQHRERLDVRATERLDSLMDALDDPRYALGNTALPINEQTDLKAREMELQQEVDTIIGSVETEGDSLTLEAVQRALRPRGQVLLTYFLDTERPTAFVVRPDTFAAVPLHVSADSLQAQIGRLGSLWSPGEAPEVGLSLTPLHALYEALYAPVAPLVPEGAPLVVIPDGLLVQVPFGLLLERDHPRFEYAGAPYLLRRHPITVELAAALLQERELPRADERAVGLLALGRSQFEDPSVGTASRRVTPGLEELPNVEAELRRLARRAGDARAALDEEATEAFFDAHRDDARVIHLASHAFVDPLFPLYSHVVLWDDPANEDDGTLYLYELQSRPLHADLVTLSGCSTARGRSRVGEGMIGLQYAFRAAGARATLATLWQVEDEATADLMDRFYLHLSRGLPKDEALRQAQLDYLDRHPDGPEASPFFWAAPVLYGDTAPVPLATGAFPATLWISVGLLLVLAGITLPRLRRRPRLHG